MARVIVQTLCTRWTKQSRGAPASIRRNATPEQLVLDPTRILPDQATWHEVTFHEPDFLPTETYRGRSLPNDFLRASVFLEPEAHVLAVRFFGSVRLTLNRGQLGQLLYNLSEDGPLDGWYQTIFQKVIVRVAFDLTPQTHLFHRPPDQQYASMRELT
jgi:hypothetical protein